MRPSSILFTLISSLLTSTLATTPSPLTLRVPAHIPPLPYTTRAILTTTNHTHKAPITRSNTFVFPDIHTSTQSNPNQKKLSYLLDIACRDYDFMSYGVDVGRGGKVEIYRVGRGGIEMGGREVVGEEGVEVRVLRIREYYEERAGFSPLSLLKNPMILIAVVGLGFVIGMPYLMDNMDPEMRKEFEEQQKKSILSGGASTANPLQNFDMAAWMAGKTAGSAEQAPEESSSGSGSKVRRRG